MVMKKAMNSEGMFVISSDKSDKFPPGFQYVLGGITRTVREVLKKDAHAEMRKVIASDGSEEIVPLESMEKDVADPQCHIVCTGEKCKKESKKEEKSD